MKWVLQVMVGGCLLLAAPVQGANWLMLQGTEPAGAKPFRLYGSLVADYQYTDDTPLPAGPFAGQPAVFNQIGPQLESASQLTLRKIRLGGRGVLPDPDFNYCFLLFGGDNGITRLEEGDRVRMIDASLTVNKIPGARLRLGMFKYPGSEEGLQFNPPGTYVNYSNMANQLLLERFYVSDGSDPLDANIPGASGNYRDLGLMLFDAFKRDNWEHTYAAMVGNGHGVNLEDDNSAPEFYLYWSSERIFSGKGMGRHGLKLFAWLQDGERTMQVLGVEQDIDRRRFGGGAILKTRDLRAGFEITKADGIIPNSVDSGGIPGSWNNALTAVSSYNVLPEEEALGWYADLGYRLLGEWWLDVRYDRLDRGTVDPANERRFTTLTLGSHYWLTKKTKITINYEIRDNEAPNQPASSPINQIMDSYDNRFSLQLFWML